MRNVDNEGDGPYWREGDNGVSGHGCNGRIMGCPGVRTRSCQCVVYVDPTIINSDKGIDVCRKGVPTPVGNK